METLTPTEAAELAGVPVAQLMRWAWDDWDVYEKRAMGLSGPKSTGTRGKPVWRRADVIKWRRKYQGGTDAGTTDA